MVAPTSAEGLADGASTASIASADIDSSDAPITEQNAQSSASAADIVVTTSPLAVASVQPDPKVRAQPDPELRALCNAWLPPEVRLVAWDFDNTLLNIHAYNKKITPADVPGRWKRDVCDLELVRVFMRTARERGVALGIASFGKQEVILAYMDEILKGTPDEGAFTAANVGTPASLGLREGRTVRPNGKPRLLKLLREYAATTTGKEKVEISQTVFFDDQRANIESCRLNGITRAVHTPDGFTRSSKALTDPRAQQRIAKPPPSFTMLAKLTAGLRMPAAVFADVKAARRRLKASWT